jgi:REP element-mobilizing transposase RayT
MPRGPRLRIEGAFYHVYSRGNRRQSVFLDDRDRRLFLRRLRKLEAATGAVRVAHCLMPNHFHLLIRPGAGGISQFMHRLLGEYALGFNRRHEAVGHLFQGRFGSRPILGADDLLLVLRYVHFNPVKAGLVSSLGDWEWSSHRAHLRPVPPPELSLGVHLVRGLLATGRDPDASSSARYRALMDEPAPREEEVFPRPGSAPGPVSRGTILVPPSPDSPLSIEALVERVARIHGVPPADVSGPSRRRVLIAARRDLIRTAVREYGHPVRAVARALGCSGAVAYRHLQAGDRARRRRKRGPRTRRVPAGAKAATAER